jgi:hypothetical protein
MKERKEPPCVVGLPGEAPADTAARIHAEGRKTGALIAPHVPSVEEWARQAESYQRWLLSRCAGIAEPGFTEPSAAEIDASYRASMT